MAMPQNQIPQNAQEMVLNLANALGVKIEIKGTQEETEGPEKKKRTPKILPKVLKPGEPQKMMDSFKIHRFADMRDRAIFQVLYSSGLRISEITNLMVDDVNLEDGYLNLQKAKGGKDRNIPIDEDEINWMKKWEVIRPESEYYFCTKKGGKLSVRQLRDKIYQISDRSGVYIRDGVKKRRVFPHALRHTCFTECLEDGLSLTDIQELAGHSNIHTSSIYLHVRPEMLKEKIRNRKK